jgi:fluoroacetyl-CoA thioesterase
LITLTHVVIALTHVVGPDDTAVSLGSGGVDVLATPRLLAWLEAATVSACPELDAGETSVGTRVDIEHLLASPIGARVDVQADLIHRDGRLLRFTVAAHHDVGAGPVLIGRGEVTRVVVRRDAFHARSVPSLIIREATPGEWEQVGELCVDAYTRGSGFPTGTDGYVSVLRDVAGRAPHGDVLVALADGRIVGTVTVLRAGSHLAEVAREGEVEFRFMAVAPEAWRSGLGRALVDAVLARAEGAPVTCCVIDGNDPAAALYASLGFDRDPSRDREPVPGILLRAYRRSS